MSDDPDTLYPEGSINDSLIKMTHEIGAAIEGVCTYGLTIGQDYVPFDPDEDDDCDVDDETMCLSQAWVRVASVSPGQQSTSFGGTQIIATSLDLEVGVIRCLEIAEDGNAPTASEVLAAGLQAMDDMNTLLCTVLATEVWEEVTVGQWTPMGPLGGQHGGAWSFTVDVLPQQRD